MIKGFKELSKTLKTLEKKTQQKVLRRGSAKMAQVIAKEMKVNAPKDSGYLKKSITYKNKRMISGGFNAKVGAYRTNRANGYHAKFVEFGTKRHKIKPKDNGSLSVKGRQYKVINHPGANAKPFLETSFKKSYIRAQKVAGDLMFKLIGDLA